MPAAGKASVGFESLGVVYGRDCVVGTDVGGDKVDLAIASTEAISAIAFCLPAFAVADGCSVSGLSASVFVGAEAATWDDAFES